MGRAARPQRYGRAAFQLVLTTCPDQAAAEHIAEALVGEDLAACVNVLPIAQSVYRWQGKIEKSSEYLLVIKTAVSAFTAVKRRLRKLHTYELPEIIAVPITAGSSEYLKWLANPDSIS